MNTTPRNEFLGGIQAELPILVGVIPFGMIYGALARSAGMPPGAAQAMSAVVFAGSSQFIMAQLWGEATPIFVILVTVLIVNLRHGLYSASIAPYVKHLSSSWKWLLSYLLTDEAYAVAIVHYRQVEDGSGGKVTLETGKQHWYFLGAGLALWSTWQISTAVGILLGAVIPDSLSLDFTLTLTFIALVMPTLKGKGELVAALVGGTVAVIGAAWPLKLGLLCGALTGILAGLWSDRK
ncbi:MAG: AzlC family ABC transporter permease [Anaerolineales bacterium]|nr:AzlC family ABC transporter permease [Anaerolineales bacterium]